MYMFWTIAIGNDSWGIHEPQKAHISVRNHTKGHAFDSAHNTLERCGQPLDHLKPVSMWGANISVPTPNKNEGEMKPLLAENCCCRCEFL